MSALTNSDLNAALGLVHDAAAFPDEESFRSGILPRLGELVPCDVVGYSEVDVKSGTVQERYDPVGVVPDWCAAALAEYVDEHPVIVRAKQGDLRALAISDFLTEREFHGLGLYQDLFRGIDAEDQIAFGLPGEVIIGVAFNRPRRGFTKRERELLELLRPHLTQAVEHVRERERSRAMIEALQAGLEEMSGAVVIVDGHGRVEEASDFARQLLQAYIGDDRSMESVFEDWLAAVPGTSLFAMQGSRGTLTVRTLERGDGAAGVALLLSETRSGPPGIAALTQLGVTKREAEILRLLSGGSTNEDIAERLEIAVGTVRKHLERIYGKLGVHSRSEAAARAWNADSRKS